MFYNTVQLGVTLKSVPVRSSVDFEAAFLAMVRDRVAALSITTSPLFGTEGKRLAALAMKHQLPTVGGSREMAEAGILVAYGTDYPNLFRQAATFVDKILKGPKPGDLPIQQPTKFEMIVNMKTAKTLGIKFPGEIMLQATKVIE